MSLRSPNVLKSVFAEISLSRHLFISVFFSQVLGKNQNAVAVTLDPLDNVHKMWCRCGPFMGKGPQFSEFHQIQITTVERKQANCALVFKCHSSLMHNSLV